jgi:hypothetical protein
VDTYSKAAALASQSGERLILMLELSVPVIPNPLKKAFSLA